VHMNQKSKFTPERSRLTPERSKFTTEKGEHNERPQTPVSHRDPVSRSLMGDDSLMSAVTRRKPGEQSMHNTSQDSKPPLRGLSLLSKSPMLCKTRGSAPAHHSNTLRTDDPNAPKNKKHLTLLKKQTEVSGFSHQYLIFPFFPTFHLRTSITLENETLSTLKLGHAMRQFQSHPYYKQLQLLFHPPTPPTPSPPSDPPHNSAENQLNTLLETEICTILKDYEEKINFKYHIQDDSDKDKWPPIKKISENFKKMIKMKNSVNNNLAQDWKAISEQAN
jgi:hypothetical protein